MGSALPLLNCVDAAVPDCATLNSFTESFPLSLCYSVQVRLRTQARDCSAGTARTLVVR